MSFKYKVKDLSLLSEKYGFKKKRTSHHYDYYVNEVMGLAVTVTPKYFHTNALYDDERVLSCYKLEILGNSFENKHLRHTLVETKNPTPTEESKRVDQNKLMNKVQKILRLNFDLVPTKSYYEELRLMHNAPIWVLVNKIE